MIAALLLAAAAEVPCVWTEKPKATPHAHVAASGPRKSFRRRKPLFKADAANWEILCPPEESGGIAAIPHEEEIDGPVSMPEQPPQHEDPTPTFAGLVGEREVLTDAVPAEAAPVEVAAQWFGQAPVGGPVYPLLNLPPVPEPHEWLLMLGGLGYLIRLRTKAMQRPTLGDRA